MALTPQVRTSQAFVNVVASGDPTPEARVSQAFANVVVGGAAPQSSVAQAFVNVVALGETGSRRVRAFSFSLDGHDFYVLHLGRFDTLVFDLSTGQWFDWRSTDRNLWRAVHGINWIGIGAGSLDIADHNANVVAGDDEFGLLWFLDPEQGFDDDPIDGSEVAFERIVTGGVPIRRRDTVRCNEVYLSAVKGEFDISLEAPFVRLQTSDDADRSYQNQGSVSVVSGDFEQEFAWRSLGLIGAPGRTFEITDNCLARIDNLEMR